MYLQRGRDVSKYSKRINEENKKQDLESVGAAILAVIIQLGLKTARHRRRCYNERKVRTKAEMAFKCIG